MYKVYVLNFKTNLVKMLTLPSWQWPCRVATYLFFLLRTSCLPLPPLWFQYSLPGKDHAPGCSQPVNERGGGREIVRGCFGRNVNHLKHSPYAKNLPVSPAEPVSELHSSQRFFSTNLSPTSISPPFSLFVMGVTSIGVRVLLTFSAPLSFTGFSPSNACILLILLQHLLQEQPLKTTNNDISYPPSQLNFFF